MTERDDAIRSLANELEVTLVRQYGPLLAGESLRQALGYQSLDALRQAMSRKTFPVPVFAVPHRRSKHALTKDVAQWLAQQRLCND